MVDARVNLPMMLARVDVVEPTPPATLVLKESIEAFGFKVSPRIAPSNQPVAQWAVRLRFFGE